MKHLTLLGALLVTATTSVGCGHCDPSELFVSWTFTDAAGQVIRTCAPGVDSLVVFIDGQPQTDYISCASYSGASVAVRSGNYQLQVDAYDVNGAPIYVYGPTAVSVRSCGATAVEANLSLYAASLSLTLPATQSFTFCPGNSYIWYTLTDLTTNQVYQVDGLNTPQALPCNGTVKLRDALPLGPYQIDNVQVVAYQGSSVVPQFSNCDPQQFTHAADDAAQVTVSPTTRFCPP